MVEDSKVPDRPFALKCPKCQNLVRLPGRASAPQPAADPAPLAPVNANAESTPGATTRPAPVDSPPGPRSPSEPAPESSRAAGAPRPSGSQGSALVALGDSGQASAMASTLTRQGYTVDSLSDMEEAVRLLEQGFYTVAVTTPTTAQPGQRDSLYQRILRLAPETRRQIFLILLGEGFKTGEASQAFAAIGDLVVNPQELGAVDDVLRKTVAERSRMYQVFLDTLAREEGRQA
jgi:hypothetical protein